MPTEPQPLPCAVCGLDTWGNAHPDADACIAHLRAANKHLNESWSIAAEANRNYGAHVDAAHKEAQRARTVAAAAERARAAMERDIEAERASMLRPHAREDHQRPLGKDIVTWWSQRVFKVPPSRSAEDARNLAVRVEVMASEVSNLQQRLAAAEKARDDAHAEATELRKQQERDRDDAMLAEILARAALDAIVRLMEISGAISITAVGRDLAGNMRVHLLTAAPSPGADHFFGEGRSSRWGMNLGISESSVGALSELVQRAVAHCEDPA